MFPRAGNQFASTAMRAFINARRWAASSSGCKASRTFTSGMRFGKSYIPGPRMLTNLCRILDLENPAQELIARFPKAQMVQVETVTPNGKVGVLMDLERVASNPVMIVNDAATGRPQPGIANKERSAAAFNVTRRLRIQRTFAFVKAADGWRCREDELAPVNSGTAGGGS